MNRDFVYEEQKQLIEMWKNKYYEQKEEIERLKKENKILKESLGIKSPSKEMLEGKYWETKEIRKLKKEKKELDDYILELEIVINKAIRYTENNLCDNKARVKENISGKDIDGLLEILGSDKE